MYPLDRYSSSVSGSLVELRWNLFLNSKYESKSLTPQFQLHKILWVAASSAVGTRVERRHHLQSVCFQDVVLVDQTDENRLGLSLVAVALTNRLMECDTCSNWLRIGQLLPVEESRGFLLTELCNKFQMAITKIMNLNWLKFNTEQRSEEEKTSQTQTDVNRLINLSDS
ncbi:hypothetical protein AVEN_138607-1, partial [Araneus ventricosus]